jgi:hypothetical protein
MPRLNSFLFGVEANERVKKTKTLSENRYFGEDQLSAGQLKKSKIVLPFLLPAHQEPAGAVELGMRSFHSPTTSTIARDDLLLSFLFTPTADVRLVVPHEQFLVHRS